MNTSRILFSMIGVCVLGSVCFAQSGPSTFEEEHDRGVKQNPPGVTLSIATVDGRSAFHLSEWVKLRLAFTSARGSLYTAELAGAGNAASTTDHFILQPSGSTTILHRTETGGVVCCDAKWRYLKRTPIIGLAQVLFSQLWAYSLHPLDPFATDSGAPALQPGDYEFFMQTRRVLRGRPKSEAQLYHRGSDLAVTSSNILHITLLPDEPLPAQRPPPK